MTKIQKVIKYLAMAFAVFLSVGIIGGALGLLGALGGFFINDAVSDEMTMYSISSNITELKIEIGAADFTIEQGENFSVESNLKYISVDDLNGVLTIQNTKKFIRNYKGAILRLYIPADMTFEGVDILTGAGKFTLDYLCAERIDFVLGAGEVTINKLIANVSAEIEGGAGKITISDGVLCNLDLEMGVGQLNLTSALRGESKLNLGVGESNITVLGKKDDYRLDIEKGIGSITVDGTNVSNMENFGNGSNFIEISGGVGSIHLQFKE